MIVHAIHFPVSARSFVAPVVADLVAHGIAAELWVQDHPRHRDAIAALGCPHRLVDMDLTANPVRFARRLSAFRAQLREARPTALHAHQTRAALIPLLAARLEGVPVRIYHNHGLPYLGHAAPLRWALAALERANAAQATQVLLVSHGNLREAEGDGLFAQRSPMVLAEGSAAGIDLDGWDAARFAPEAATAARAQFGAPASGFVVGFVGRPVRRKGFHALLRAWRIAGLAARGGTLLCAGCTQAECDAALGEAVAGVRAVGYLGEMRPFYAACDAVALPSEHEGFPYALLEGAAAGRALLGTRVPGVDDAVVDGETGLLVPPRDDAALAAALARLEADPGLRLALGAAARQRVERMFDRRLVLDAYRALYRDLEVA